MNTAAGLPTSVPLAHSPPSPSMKCFSGAAMLPKRVGLPSARPAHSTRSLLLDVGRAFVRHRRRRRLGHRRHRRHRAQPRAHAVDLADAARDLPRQPRHRTAAAVVEHQDVGHRTVLRAGAQDSAVRCSRDRAYDVRRGHAIAGRGARSCRFHRHRLPSAPMEPLDSLNRWSDRMRDRARARHLLPLPVPALPRRPPVRGRRRACLHHRVRAGAAVDGGVRRAVGVPGVRRVERSPQRLHLRQLRAQRGAVGRDLSQAVLRQRGPADHRRRDRAGGVAADHPQRRRDRRSTASGG